MFGMVVCNACSARLKRKDMISKANWPKLAAKVTGLGHSSPTLRYTTLVHRHLRMPEWERETRD